MSQQSDTNNSHRTNRQIEIICHIPTKNFEIAVRFFSAKLRIEYAA